METIDTILQKAQQRARDMNLPYKGALLPAEAFRILQENSQAQLVDVRTRAELDWVGRIPDATAIELLCYPSMQLNPDFLNELTQHIDKKAPVLFICRSGARSGQAASIATEADFIDSYNILEGFEGDKDDQGHRGKAYGWKAAGLPWEQS